MGRYDNSKVYKSRGVQTIGTSYLPKFKESNSDVLLISTDGDRCDMLAQEYYGDTSLWWFVASVNNLKSNNIEPGTQLRIPNSTEQAIIK